jgi:hypothetical protein
LFIKEILNQVQDDRELVIPDPDPESPRSFKGDLCFLADKEILNQVQDDGGATACAASLRSDRFGSDATNDKQLSLASRVSHSEPQSGIPSITQKYHTPQAKKTIT